MSDLRQWLTGLGLERFAEAFEQQVKSWELRTSTSLARLWQSQGKRKDARSHRGQA